VRARRRAPRRSRARSRRVGSFGSDGIRPAFIIVRGETKEYGTAKRIEGPFEPGELVCLLEDVVTSGGALAEAVSAIRDEGLAVRNAVCVVDREEGGSDLLARLGVRLRSLFRASELLERKIPGKRHG